MKPCTSCGQLIHLLKDASTGRWVPIEDEINPNGNIRVDIENKTATVLTGDALANARLAGEKLSLNHFATCPYGPKHRKT